MSGLLPLQENIVEDDGTERSGKRQKPLDVRSAARGYRGRIAPSPSGHLHVGHARTFWIAQERAKKYQGKLILRVEDIDVQRCKPHYLPDMIEDLKWFGIRWDEGYQGPFEESQIKIPYDSYLQSKRFPLYAAAWKILLDRGFIYPCSQSRRDVDAALSAPHDDVHINQEERKKKKQEERPMELQKFIEQIPNESIFPVSLRPKCLDGIPYGLNENSFLPEEFRNQKTPYDRAINWRFRVPDDFRAIKFIDGQCGEQILFPSEDFGDFLVWRVDGYPSYELAVIVDDILMGITEVVRGQDLLISTARQLLLMKAIFGLDYESPSHWHTRPASPLQLSTDNDELVAPIVGGTEEATKEDGAAAAGGEEEMEDADRIADLFDTEKHGYLLPVYFHLPLVCDETGKRLAKRNMAKSLRTLRAEGQTPEALREQYFHQQKPSV